MAVSITSVLVPAVLLAAVVTGVWLQGLPRHPATSTPPPERVTIAGVPNVDVTSCTVPRVPGLTLERFQREFKGVSPVVFSTAAANDAFRRHVGMDTLLEAYGDIDVILASSNSFSHDRLHTTLADYLANLMPLAKSGLRANETWYLFGDTRSDRWLQLQQEYVMPMDAHHDDPALSFGVGAVGSGVAFHSHGPGFSESLLGAKRWYLSQPRPAFHPDDTQLQWVAEGNVAPMECTLQQGDAIYFPDAWWHATLNLHDYNAFMSVFTHE